MEHFKDYFCTWKAGLPKRRVPATNIERQDAYVNLFISLQEYGFSKEEVVEAVEANKHFVIQESYNDTVKKASKWKELVISDLRMAFNIFKPHVKVQTLEKLTYKEMEALATPEQKAEAAKYEPKKEDYKETWKKEEPEFASESEPFVDDTRDIFRELALQRIAERKRNSQ